ncbi:uncharacterized protein EV420DRAFT_367509 [Desarmillaria tabescens]|uniref:DUF6697 domain-containing protein n=1 Tax=Armillaria tabescens TaxID=1929756 RepID=A0AA39KGX0_ARMTA|nr:uncharacterized protein EV420DRAFT_367509 [Desarmillaria tabescens]KAK0458608.1 hypothetical protein EV420DRAFT_367509 [Desarmillaria tabescens]
MAAVPPFLHGPGMTPEVFKCLEVWWASKYKDGHDASIKDFEQLKVAYGFQANSLKSCQANNARLNSAIATLQAEAKLLKKQNELLQGSIHQAKWHEQQARGEVLALKKDKQDLVERLAAIEKKTTGLSKQIDTFRVQAKALAAQAHQRRLEIVSLAFGTTCFVEDSFVPTRVVFKEPAEIMSTLPSEPAESLHILFLPGLPQSMPLHIPRVAQAGYWFHPPVTLPKGTPVELVVEAESHEWLYLGRYLSAPFDGEEMKLSEWIELDAQTKKTYCVTISQTLKEQNDQQVSCVDIHRQLDSGEYAAPCYSLQCVGYDLALQDAFIKASTSLRNQSLAIEHDSSPTSSNPPPPQIPLSTRSTVIPEHCSLHAPVPSMTMGPFMSRFMSRWRVNLDNAGRSRPTGPLSQKKRCHLDDEASATKKARVDDPLAADGRGKET